VPAVETRRFPLLASRKHREQFREEIRDICRELGLQCEIRVRRGILTGGLTVDVTGPPEQLDAYGARQLAIFERFIDDETVERVRSAIRSPQTSALMSAVETRDFHVPARRKHRKQFSEEIRDICRELDLPCEIRVRRGIVTGGLTVSVTGPPYQLAAYFARQMEMIERESGVMLGDGPGVDAPS